MRIHGLPVLHSLPARSPGGRCVRHGALVDALEALSACGGRAQGLATRRQLLAAGVSEGGLARAVADRRLVRVRRSVYAAAPLPPLPRHVVTADGVAPAYALHVRAALLSLGTGATARGRTAAALRGWGLLVEPGRTVAVAVPHGRSHPGAPLTAPRRVRRVDREQVVVLPGTRPLWLTGAARTVAELAATRPLLEAVVACDSAVRAGAVTPDELERAAERSTGRVAARLGEVLRLSDGRAGSVLESVHRVQMVLAGIDGFDLQVVVRDVPALRVDFCFRAAGLVVEVDGARWHTDPATDRERDNALAALGWRVLRFTWAQVVHRPEQVLDQVTEALACGGPSTRSVREGQVRSA